MKKALFIIQSYPSNRSANVLCDEKIMFALQKTGEWDIHCLAYHFHGQSLFQIVNGFKVHRFKRGLWWNIYTYARDHENKAFFRFLVNIDRLFMRMRQIIFTPIYPCTQPTLTRIYTKNAIKLQKKENFDLIIAEYNGRDTLFAGSKIKELFPEVKLISILWDPISGKTLPKYLPKSYSEKKLLIDEVKILKASDRIISMQSNKEYQEKHSSNKPFYSKISYLDIPGIHKQNQARELQNYTQKDMINIIYSGVLSIPDRDPTKIIDILNMSNYSKKINLLFFSIGSKGVAVTKAKLKQFSGSSLVHGYVSKYTLNSIIESSQILLNIGGQNSGMVPSKLFEYMSFGKPIISTYYIDNESSKSYLDKYPLSLCLDIRKSTSECANQLDQFIENNCGNVVSFETVSSLFPLNTPTAYIEVINDVMK